MFNFHISVISSKCALAHKILKTYSYNIKRRLNMYVYIFRYINVNIHIYSILKNNIFSELLGGISILYYEQNIFFEETRNIYFTLKVKYFAFQTLSELYLYLPFC